MERRISAVAAKDWTRALAGMVVIVVVMEECGVEEDFMRSGVQITGRQIIQYCKNQ
jgi:hypothetical protein